MGCLISVLTCVKTSLILFMLPVLAIPSTTLSEYPSYLNKKHHNKGIETAASNTVVGWQWSDRSIGLILNINNTSTNTTPYYHTRDLHTLAPRKGKGIKICLIDTVPEHSKKFISKTNAFDLLLMHGSHTLGILKALAPQSTIYAISPCNKNGSSTKKDLIGALIKASLLKPQILVLPLKLEDSLDPSKPASIQLNNLLKEFPYVVASSGNDSHNFLSYPARFENTTFSAGAFGFDKGSYHIPSFSQYEKNRGPDFLLPGVHIESQQSSTMSGTSAAAAHLAGCLALVLAQCPHLTPLMTKNLLKASGFIPDDVLKPLASPEKFHSKGNEPCKPYSIFQQTHARGMQSNPKQTMHKCNELSQTTSEWQTKSLNGILDMRCAVTLARIADALYSHLACDTKRDKHKTTNTQPIIFKTSLPTTYEDFLAIKNRAEKWPENAKEIDSNKIKNKKTNRANNTHSVKKQQKRQKTLGKHFLTIAQEQSSQDGKN